MQAPEPDAKPLTATTTSQALTPMDEQHTIYYYSGWEDNAIIEAQQRVITRTPQPHMLGIRADHALNGSAG